MAMIKLAPPWVTFASEMEQMFKYDSEVHVVYDNDEHEIKLYVDSAAKADALTKLLPVEKKYGNITLKIAVVPANGTFAQNENLYQTAFKGNGAFSFLKTIRGIFANDLTYVVFKNKVVQYFNDDLGDIYGQCSTLYQEIAKHIFGEAEGVFFCTDVQENTLNLDWNNPLGEWP